MLNKLLPITIAAGHSGNIGARGCGYKEEVLTKELVALLVTRFKALGYNIIDVSPTGSYTASNQLVAEYTAANKIANAQLHICVHFNASNGQGHGTETWIYALNNTAHKFATAINDAVYKTLDTRNRGIKASGNSLAIPRRVNAPVCLLETVFIDNQSDMDKYVAKKEQVADAIVKALTGQAVVVETSKPENTVTEAKPQVQEKTDLQKRAEYVGSRCKELQEKLNKLGYSCGTADGIFGKNTEAALLKFQKENGLAVDGYAGPATFAKLDQLIAAKNTVTVNNWVLRLQKELNAQKFKDSNGKALAEDGIAGKATLSACPTVKQKAKGNLTKLIQEKVGVTVDGDFGPATHSAVITYQKSKRLDQDGIVGTKTWTKFLGL